VRARINVLSEMPKEWYAAIRRWSKMNRRWKVEVDGVHAPDAGEEYLLYQTLVGTWPLLEMNAEQHAEYVKRIQAYMEKALHEAKTHSSWISPNAAYDKAIFDFVERLLERSGDNAFLEDLRQFQAPIAKAGMWNSLSQLLVKVASPGVPDFYQGSELWNFHLVDPDNRQPVDYEMRSQMARKLQSEGEKDQAALLARLTNRPCDGAIKLFLTSRALRFRREQLELFAEGSYLPLAAKGSRSNHVIAFARVFEGRTVLALASRFYVRLCNSHGVPWGEQTWGNTTVVLPKKIAAAGFRDIFSGQRVEAERHGEESGLSLAKVFASCPVALLFSEGGA